VTAHLGHAARAGMMFADWSAQPMADLSSSTPHCPGSPTSTATQLGAHLDMSRQHVTRMAEQGVIIRRSSARKRKSFGA
jgi:hypothetical protein